MPLPRVPAPTSADDAQRLLPDPPDDSVDQVDQQIDAGLAETGCRKSGVGPGRQSALHRSAHPRPSRRDRPPWSGTAARVLEPVRLRGAGVALHRRRRAAAHPGHAAVPTVWVGTGQAAERRAEYDLGGAVGNHLCRRRAGRAGRAVPGAGTSVRVAATIRIRITIPLAEPGSLRCRQRRAKRVSMGSAGGLWVAKERHPRRTARSPSTSWHRHPVTRKTTKAAAQGAADGDDFQTSRPHSAPARHRLARSRPAAWT